MSALNCGYFVIFLEEAYLQNRFQTTICKNDFLRIGILTPNVFIYRELHVELGSHARDRYYAVYFFRK
jgi:hypothetical protein